MTITAAPPRRADAPPVSPVVAEALRLLAAGLSVLPIAANGTKAPASCIASWKEFQTRRLTEAEAATMFRGNVGLAIISGAISGNLETLDFDEAGLYAQYEQAAADHGLLEFVQSLPLVETPTGGAHLRYRCAEPVAGNQKLAQKEIPGEDGKPKVKTRIETRGEGGYALAPPSPAACHELQRPYVLLRGDLAAIPVLSPAEILTLHNLARLFHEYEENAPPVKAESRREASERMEGTRPGEDFDNRGLGIALDMLQAAGWKARTHGDGWHLARPGKTKGSSATLNIVPNCLHVFSSNAAPFADGGTYSPFAIYAHLKHGGDFSEAARALYAENYGDRVERGKEDRPLLMRPPAAIETEAVLTLDQWKAYGKKIQRWKSRCDDEFRWQGGDWWNATTEEIPHGEKVNFLKKTFGENLARQIRNAASICKKWPVESRFPDRPFWWHVELAGQPDEVRAEYAEKTDMGKDAIRAALKIPADPPRPKTVWQLLREQFPEEVCILLLKAAENQDKKLIIKKIEAALGLGGYDAYAPPAQHFSDGELIEAAQLHVRQLDAAQQENEQGETSRNLALQKSRDMIFETDFQSQNDGFSAKKSESVFEEEAEDFSPDFSEPLELMEKMEPSGESDEAASENESLYNIYTLNTRFPTSPDAERDAGNDLPTHAVVSAAPVVSTLTVPPADESDAPPDLLAPYAELLTADLPEVVSPPIPVRNCPGVIATENPRLAVAIAARNIRNGAGAGGQRGQSAILAAVQAWYEAQRELCEAEP